MTLWSAGNPASSRQWRDPDTGHYGEIVPSRPYKRGVADCRDYTHTVYIDGRPQQMRGTACRSSGRELAERRLTRCSGRFGTFS